MWLAIPRPPTSPIHRRSTAWKPWPNTSRCSPSQTGWRCSRPRGGPLNVTAVVEASGLSQATGLSQALVSKHLKLLTIAGVVQRRPEGSLVFYEVIDKAVLKLLGQAEMLLLATRRHQLS